MEQHGQRFPHLYTAGKTMMQLPIKLHMGQSTTGTQLIPVSSALPACMYQAMPNGLHLQPIWVV
jgi:hypothetical protein